MFRTNQFMRIATTSRRYLILPFVLLTLAATACSGSPTAPAARSFPSVLGVYSSSRWFSFTLTQLSTGLQVNTTCGGSMTISTQSGSSFAGSFIRQGCSVGGAPPTQTVISGNLVDGVVRADGGLNFNLVVPGQDPGFLAGIGCTTTSSDALYSGALSGNTISATRNMTMNCTGVRAVSLNITIRGTR